MAIPQVTSSQGAPRLPFYISTKVLQQHLMVLKPYLESLETSRYLRRCIERNKMTCGYQSVVIDIDKATGCRYGQVWFREPIDPPIEEGPIEYLFALSGISEDGI